MPYVEQERAKKLQEGASPHNAGELTFLLCDSIRRFLLTETPSFLAYADVLAALESTRHEFERTVLDPYEDSKRARNGWTEGVFAPHSRRAVTGANVAATIEDALVRARRKF